MNCLVEFLAKKGLPRRECRARISWPSSSLDLSRWRIGRMRYNQACWSWLSPMSRHTCHDYPYGEPDMKMMKSMPRQPMFRAYSEGQYHFKWSQFRRQPFYYARCMKRKVQPDGMAPQSWIKIEATSSVVPTSISDLIASTSWFCDEISYCRNNRMQRINMIKLYEGHDSACHEAKTWSIVVTSFVLRRHQKAVHHSHQGRLYFIYRVGRIAAVK